jgi:hypothetical protein
MVFIKLFSFCPNRSHDSPLDVYAIGRHEGSTPPEGVQAFTSPGGTLRVPPDAFADQNY